MKKFFLKEKKSKLKADIKFVNRNKTYLVFWKLLSQDVCNVKKVPDQFNVDQEGPNERSGPSIIVIATVKRH